MAPSSAVLCRLCWDSELMGSLHPFGGQNGNSDFSVAEAQAVYCRTSPLLSSSPSGDQSV